MILLMKCPLTPDYSRAGAVPATQRTSPNPALFSAPDPTHYREWKGMIVKFNNERKGVTVHSAPDVV